MKVPATLDLRRRRLGASRSRDPIEGDGEYGEFDEHYDGDEYEYEYVYEDVDDPGDGDVEDGHPAGDGGGSGPVVDPRIAARRDGIAQARRDRRRRWLIAVGVVVSLVVGAGAYTRSAALDVDQVRVSGAIRSDPADLIAAAGIPVGTPLVGLDLGRALAAVRAEPWVLGADISHDWSGTVAITVVEREPVATVNGGAAGWLLIDGGRRVVAASTTPPDLPIVDGVGAGSVGDELDPSAQGALDVAEALGPALRSRITIVHGADPGAIELALQPAGTVRFGPATQIDERIRSLQTVFAQVDLLCLATIDLRVPDAPVLTRVPACA